MERTIYFEVDLPFLLTLSICINRFIITIILLSSVSSYHRVYKLDICVLTTPSKLAALELFCSYEADRSCLCQFKKVHTFLDQGVIKAKTIKTEKPST